MTIFYVNQNATGNNDGSSWVNAFTDLQAALEITAANDEIWVAEGTYKPTTGTRRGTSFDIPSGIDIYGGFVGGETSLEQRDWLNNITILSGDIGQEGVRTDNSFTVVDISSATISTLIDGFTISDSQDGPGVRGSGGNATLRNLIIRDNNSDGGGGFFSFGGDNTLINVAFINNFSGGRGGAIYTTTGGTVTVENGLFIGNEAQTGGAIYGIANVTNSTFFNNQAATGGALYLFRNLNNESGASTIENSIIWNNSESDNQIVTDPGDAQAIVNNSIVEEGYAGPGTGIIDADPLFFDPSNNDLRLQRTSPGVDAGNNNIVTTTTDIVNNPRIFNNTVDIGAYEYGVFLSIEDTTVVEGNNGTTNAEFLVTLRDSLELASAETVTVNYNTLDDTAIEGLDYADTEGSLTFNVGETSQTIGVPILGDQQLEGNERFFVQLGDVTGNAVISDGLATGTITNDDGTTFNRFQNSSLPGTYLFAGPEESESIRASFPNFIDEGPAFRVATEPGDNLIAFNRFQNRNVPGTYLFAGPEESASIRASFPNFDEEGIAFYVYRGSADIGVDIYRFQNLAVPGTYIFVTEQERQNILANFPSFVEEGVAFEVGV